MYFLFFKTIFIGIARKYNENDLIFSKIETVVYDEILLNLY